MDKQLKLDRLFSDIADRISEESHARRLKVGCVIVKDGNIISMGWNGMPSGMDNNCEIEQPDGTLITRREVSHAESNAIGKLAARGGVGALGATIYTSYSPCAECAKLIKQANITRVVFRRQYRLPDGIDMLKALGVECTHLFGENE